jgi:hypothetical protein
LTGLVLGAGGLALFVKGAFSETQEPAQEVLKAIRLLLSEDPKEEARGEHALKRMGVAVAPQLRFWIRKVRNEAERVEIVLADLEGTKPDSLSAEKVTANDFFHRKLLECRSLVQAGELRRALELADAILLLDKKSPYAWELRRLARQTKERLVRKEVLEPSLDVEKLVYEVGEKPQILFRVTNHDSRPARIRLSKGVMGEMDLSVQRQFLDGSMKLDKDKLRIQVPEDVGQILIGPGQAWDHPIDFKARNGFPPSGMVARVLIEGRFRPTRWTVEKENDENISLPMSRLEFWIVPGGEGAQADHPLEKLTAALFFGKLEPFFVGGQLSIWAGEDDPFFNEKLVETLIGNLDDLDSTRLALAYRFLHQATGQGFDADPKKWKGWWSRMNAGREPITDRAGPEK